MNAVLFAFTARGRETARRIAGILSGSGDSARVRVPERLAEGDCLRCVKDFRARFPGERIAVLAVNGVTAMDVLCAMQQAGITPGYDFGFCTFDDWSWFSLISPGITAVRMETKQLGARAAELLLERLRGEREDDAPAVNVELPTTFVERGSLVRQLP